MVVPAAGNPGSRPGTETPNPTVLRERIPNIRWDWGDTAEKLGRAAEQENQGSKGAAPWIHQMVQYFHGNRNTPQLFLDLNMCTECPNSSLEFGGNWREAHRACSHPCSQPIPQQQFQLMESLMPSP